MKYIIGYFFKCTVVFILVLIIFRLNDLVVINLILIYRTHMVYIIHFLIYLYSTLEHYIIHCVHTSLLPTECIMSQYSDTILLRLPLPNSKKNKIDVFI